MRHLVANAVGAVEIQQLKHKHELKVVWFTLKTLLQKTDCPLTRKLSPRAGQFCRGGGSHGAVQGTPGPPGQWRVPVNSGASFASVPLRPPTCGRRPQGVTHACWDVGSAVATPDARQVPPSAKQCTFFLLFWKM